MIDASEINQIHHGNNREGAKYINLLYFLQHREKEGGRGHWKGKNKMIRKKGEHGQLHNDFNESALSPADTLDMTTGNRREKEEKRMTTSGRVGRGYEDDYSCGNSTK